MVTLRICDKSEWCSFTRDVGSAFYNKSQSLVAPAKLNLRLVVEGRRSDGYHLLSMLNATTTLADSVSVTFTESQERSVEVISDQALCIRVEDNLVTRAFVEFWRVFGFDEPPLGFRAVIDKRIPVGGGLGGGSSDAGAMLRVLGKHWRAPLCSLHEITDSCFETLVMRAAACVGADVPFAYHGGVAWVGGVGEVVQPLNVSSIRSRDVLITVPPDPVPTVAFYKYYRERHPVLPETKDHVLRALLGAQEKGFSVGLLRNDFEADVCQFVPSVGIALRLARRYFPESSSLTGSGSAIFSLVSAGADGQVDRYCDTAQGEGMTVHRARIM